MATRRSAAEQPAAALYHINRFGEKYYLHAGTTKTGKPRYSVKRTPGPGALSAMPEGYEFSESINGVVSVSRRDASPDRIPAADVELVRRALQGHGHLFRCQVEARKNEIVVYEPSGGLGMARYEPVMKFVPTGRPGTYDVHRMTYRGEGGWSWPLSTGPLDQLAGSYIRHIGTDQFYELA
jgi:hypothetical protein